MPFFSIAHAQTAATQTGGGAASLIPFVLILVVFYFLILRPQNKRVKDHNEMVNALKRNDRVVTGGGIIGKITKVNDSENIIELEIAPDVVVQVSRNTVSEKLNKDAGKAANDDHSKKIKKPANSRKNKK